MAETMQAGRELDARVAEKVMGWRRRFGAFEGTVWNDLAVILLPFEPGKYPKKPKYTEAPATVTSPVLPHYSTDIAAAWEVVETMSTRGFRFKLFRAPNTSGQPDRAWAVFARPEVDIVDAMYAEEFGTAAPLAICLAALKALESPHAV